MSLVTTGAETWTPHTHRHHAGGSAWIFGPDGPFPVTGPFPPFAAAPAIGDLQFLFWDAAGAQGGGEAYPAFDTAPMPPPVFPAGSAPGSVIAWYRAVGGTGQPPGRPGLEFDAILETAGNWLDWDATNDPFTVSRGSRGPQPDGDDTAYTDGDEAVVTAALHFPGTFPPYEFDQWLVFGANTHVTAHDEVTQDRNTTGTAFAVYRRPGLAKPPRGPVAYDPFWWLKNSPVELVEAVRALLAAQSEVGQIATLLDAVSAMTDEAASAAVQRALYESLMKAAERGLSSGGGSRAD